MNPRLMDLDGALVVREVYEFSDKPERVINYYPTGMRSYEFTRNYGYALPLEVSVSNSGVYAISRGMYSEPLYLRLPELGATKCIKQEIEPIPCPKVRAGIQTRFWRGTWQKYLQTKGWVTA